MNAFIYRIEVFNHRGEVIAEINQESAYGPDHAKACACAQAGRISRKEAPAKANILEKITPRMFKERQEEAVRKAKSEAPARIGFQYAPSKYP